jgi:hypothetical protein
MKVFTTLNPYERKNRVVFDKDEIRVTMRT